MAVQTPTVMAHGKPFSFAGIDTSLALAKLSARIHGSVERISHLDLRLDYCLPMVNSSESDAAHRLVAAYLCHQPYRSVNCDVRLHPFRQPLLQVLEEEAAHGSKSLQWLLSVLIHGSDKDLELVSMKTPDHILYEHGESTKPLGSPTQRQEELVRKAIHQMLSMAEQRFILQAITGQNHDQPLEMENDPTEPIEWLSPILHPEDLVSTAAHNPMITCELVGRLCHEAVMQLEHRDSQHKEENEPSQSQSTLSQLQDYFIALQSLPPTLRSFDLVTRLLRCEKSAPVPMFNQDDQDLRLLPLPDNTTKVLTTTVAHLARLYSLGGFLSNGIRYIEEKQSDEETLLIAELQDTGVTQIDRHQVDNRLEERMAREVSNFCHFIRSLINAALIFPPDLGQLRRQLPDSEATDGSDVIQFNQTTRTALLDRISKMEEEVDSSAHAIVIELKHFALRFGRYRDGTRLYAELNSLI